MQIVSERCIATLRQTSESLRAVTRGKMERGREKEGLSGRHLSGEIQQGLPMKTIAF